MNRIFIVLPIAEVATAGNEAVCLRQLDGEHAAKDFLNLMKRLAQTFRFVKEESFVTYYDNKLFRELYQYAFRTVAKRERPSATSLLNMLPSLKRIDSLGAMPPITVDGVEQADGVLCAFANCAHEGSDTLLDSEILLHPQTLRVQNSQGENIALGVVACIPTDLFKWLASHRNPRRVLTESYEKHTKNEKDVDGEKVSALTYSHADAEELLQWAVGERTHNRRYFMDLKRKRLLIFWNQKEAIPTYHAYDVDLENEEEIQKMWKECGRDIVNVIKSVSKLREEN